MTAFDGHFLPIFEREVSPEPVHYTAFIGERSRKTFLSGFFLRIFDDEIQAAIKPDGTISSLTINETDYAPLFISKHIGVKNTAFFAQLFGDKRLRITALRTNLVNLVEPDITKILSNFWHGRTTPPKKAEILSRIYPSRYDLFIDDLIET